MPSQASSGVINSISTTPDGWREVVWEVVGKPGNTYYSSPLRAVTEDDVVVYRVVCGWTSGGNIRVRLYVVKCDPEWVELVHTATVVDEGGERVEGKETRDVVMADGYTSYSIERGKGLEEGRITITSRVKVVGGTILYTEEEKRREEERRREEEKRREEENKKQKEMMIEGINMITEQLKMIREVKGREDGKMREEVIIMKEELKMMREEKRVEEEKRVAEEKRREETNMREVEKRREKEKMMREELKMMTEELKMMREEKRVELEKMVEEEKRREEEKRKMEEKRREEEKRRKEDKMREDLNIMREEIKMMREEKRAEEEKMKENEKRKVGEERRHEKERGQELKMAEENKGTGARGSMWLQVGEEEVLGEAGYNYTDCVAPDLGQTGKVEKIPGEDVTNLFADDKVFRYPAAVVTEAPREVLLRADTDSTTARLDRQRKEEPDLCDLELYADGDASTPGILVHRAVMYHTAPKLREIVEKHGVVDGGGGGEKKNRSLGKMKLFYQHLGSCDHAAIEMMVQYCYGHQVTLTLGVCEELYKVATKLGLHKIGDTCHKVLKDHVPTDELVKVYMIATRIPSKELQDEVKNYILENPTKVLHNPDIEELDLVAFQTLFSEQNLRNLPKDDEIVFYKAILRWINAEYANTKVQERKEERLPHLGNLLKEIRFFFIDPHFLVKEMENEIIKGENQIIKEIYETFKRKLAPLPSDEKMKKMQGRDAQPK